ncbi:hypothetical protein BJI55_20100 [Acinetobacter pittii]|nr:hypothetical protein BJI55_20100 [Acinetobacter pittii]
MVELIQIAPALKLQIFFARCLQSLLIMAYVSTIFFYNLFSSSQKGYTKFGLYIVNFAMI